MPPNSFYEGGKGSIQVVVPLGTGAVSTVTKAIGVIPKNCRVTDVRWLGQAAVTGTSLTGQVFARTLAGAAGNAVEQAAANLKFASAAAAKTGVTGTLTTTYANRDLSEGQLLEAVFTASSITAGPGDVVVEVEFEPQV